MSLSDHFNKITSQISDFNFVIETFLVSEKFPVYARRLFLLALSLAQQANDMMFQKHN